MAKYSNEQIDAIIEEAYAQYTGNKEPGEIDLTQFTDEGTNADYVVARDRFTNALLTASTKRMYTDRAFGDSFKDEFYVDAREFGGAMTIVSIEAPEVRENPAWHDFVSGTSQVGQYTVYIPVVEEKVYAKSTSWALPFTVTDEQWDTAFASKEDLRDFVAQIFIAVENKIKEHIKNEAALNRANFIAEKMQYAATPGAKGVHAVNLVKAYLDEKGITGGMTVSEFDQNFEAKKWAIARMALDYDYIQDQSGLYNVGNKVKFIPKDRIRFQMLAHFAKKLEFDVLAPTFNKSILELPGFSTVSAWQNASDESFNTRSSISVKTKSGTFAKSGIVALIVDQYAIMHTIRKTRLASQRFDIEALTQYSYQYRDSFMNNLGLPGIVYYLADVTV